MEQLINSIHWIRDELNKRNKSVNYYSASASLVKRASNLLGKNLLSVDKIHMEWATEVTNNNVKLLYYKPAVSLPYVLELQYYANAVLPVFLLESVIGNYFIL